MEFVIKNLMETIVESKLNELIKGVDCCKCDKCRMDITAYVLNRLPAKYVSTEKGALFAELDFLNNQHDADVMSNILKAIDLIAKNPHHWTPEEAMENGIKKEEDVAKVNMPIHNQSHQRQTPPQMSVQQGPNVKTPMSAQQQRPIQSQIPVQQRPTVKTPVSAQQQRPIQSQIPVQQRPTVKTPMSSQQQRPIQTHIPVQKRPTIQSAQKSGNMMDKGQAEKLAEQVLNERLSNIKAEKKQKPIEIEKNSTKNYKSVTDVLEHIKKPEQKDESNTDVEPLLLEEDETYSSSDLDLPHD